MQAMGGKGLPGGVRALQAGIAGTGGALLGGAVGGVHGGLKAKAKELDGKEKKAGLRDYTIFRKKKPKSKEEEAASRDEDKKTKAWLDANQSYDDPMNPPKKASVGIMIPIGTGKEDYQKSETELKREHRSRKQKGHGGKAWGAAGGLAGGLLGIMPGMAMEGAAHGKATSAARAAASQAADKAFREQGQRWRESLGRGTSPLEAARAAERAAGDAAYAKAYRPGSSRAIGAAGAAMGTIGGAMLAHRLAKRHHEGRLRSIENELKEREKEKKASLSDFIEKEGKVFGAERPDVDYLGGTAPHKQKHKGYKHYFKRKASEGETGVGKATAVGAGIGAGTGALAGGLAGLAQHGSLRGAGGGALFGGLAGAIPGGMIGFAEGHKDRAKVRQAEKMVGDKKKRKAYVNRQIAMAPGRIRQNREAHEESQRLRSEASAERRHREHMDRLDKRASLTDFVAPEA
jgi:hypothetical protein